MLGQMFNALVNQAANNAQNNRGGGGGAGAGGGGRGGGRGNFQNNQNNQNNRGGNTGRGSIHSRLGNANIGLMNKPANQGNQIGLMNKPKADAPTEEIKPVEATPEPKETESPKAPGANIGLMNKPNPNSRWGKQDNQEDQKGNQNQGSRWSRGGGNQDNNRGSWSRGGGGNQGGRQQQDNADDTPKDNFGGRGGGRGRGRGGNLGNLDDEGRGGRGGRDEGNRGGGRGGGGRGGRDDGNRGGRGGRDEGGRGGGRGGSRDEGGRGGGRGGGDRGGRGRGGWGDRREGRGDWVQDKLKEMAGPQMDLPPREEVIRKFSNNCRLWIGNIPTNTEEEEVKALFEPHGEFDEFYFDKNKGFGFIRMDYKANAEKAKLALNGMNFNGRQLKLRISPPGTALKVRNLSSCVTNELLEKAFGVFGDLERAHVYVDERGRSTGEGMVEFCKKPSATNCLKRCTDGCFILSASPRPVIVEPMPVVDDTEGFSEINLNRRNYEIQKERQEGPRLGTPGSFEYEYGQKWKQLYDLFDKKKEALEKQMADEKVKLEEQMEFAKYDHETEMLREKLKVQEEINSRNKMEFEQRQKLWEENRQREEAYSQTQTEELERKYWAQEDELRRRQEENRRYLQETAEGLKGKEDNYGGGYGGDNDRKRGFSDNYGGSGGGNGYSEMTGQRGGADTMKGYGGDNDRFGSGNFSDNRGTSDFGGAGYGRGGMDDQYGRGVVGGAATEDDFQAKRARY